MSNVFSRPLFKNEFIRRYAEGGIVSTVAGPEEPMAPAPAEADPMQVLSEMALQVDATEKNLDSAESIDEILTSFAGSPKTADQARMELAEVVGRNDAMSTPESVLALVQPTMAIMAMTKQMSPPGGISELPMGGNEQADFEDEMDLLEDDMEDDNSFSEPESLAGGVDAMTPESPLPKFQTGQEVDMQAIMNKYASMRNQIPAGYGADPTSAWMALAQLGAGMAQGTSFAEGLSKGTQMAGPYMAQGAQNVREERSALSKFVAEEAARQEAQKAAEADREDQQRFQLGLTREQLAAQAKESSLNRGMNAAQHFDTLQQRKYEFDTTWNRELQKMEFEAEVQLKRDLQSAKTEAEKVKAQQEFDIKKLEIQQEFDLQKIEFENQFKKLETSAAERLIEEQMSLSGLDPRSKEYKDLKSQLVTQQLEKNTGTTVNIGGKGSETVINKQYETEQNQIEEINKSAAAARKTRAALAPVRTMLEPVRRGERPAFETGGFGDTRLAAGQALSFLDKNFNLGLGENLPKVLGGDPVAGEVLEASMAGLQVAAAESLSRATNLQVSLSQDMFPKLSRTPEGNLMIADILDREAERTIKLQDYAQRLARTYSGTIDPAVKPAEYRDELLKSAGVAEFNGFATDRPFDEKGRPIMSYNEYIMYLDKTEPLLTSEETARLQKLAESAPNSWTEAAPLWNGSAVQSTGQPWEKLRPNTVFKMNGVRYIRTTTGIVPVPAGGDR